MTSAGSNIRWCSESLVAVVLGLLLAASPISAAMALPVPVSSSLNLYAGANANAPQNGSAGIIESRDVASQLSATNPLAVSVSASSSDGSANVVVSGSATAQWNNSASGTVNFNGLGWQTTNVSNGLVDLDQENAGFHYKFVADASGSLVVNYSIVASASPGSIFLDSNLAGLNGFVFVFSELQPSGNPLFVSTVATLPGGTTKVDPTSIGTISEAVTLGDLYSFDILVGSNLKGPLQTRSAQQSATFAFDIPSAVSEPASLIVLLTGLANICFLTRGTSRTKTVGKPTHVGEWR